MQGAGVAQVVPAAGRRTPRPRPPLRRGASPGRHQHSRSAVPQRAGAAPHRRRPAPRRRHHAVVPATAAVGTRPLWWAATPPTHLSRAGTPARSPGRPGVCPSRWPRTAPTVRAPAPWRPAPPDRHPPALAAAQPPTTARPARQCRAHRQQHSVGLLTPDTPRLVWLHDGRVPVLDERAHLGEAFGVGPESAGHHRPTPAHRLERGLPQLLPIGVRPRVSGHAAARVLHAISLWLVVPGAAGHCFAAPGA